MQANIVYQSSNPGSLFPHGDYIRNYGQEGSGLGEDDSDSESGEGRRKW